jgi:uncharacterized membrane protein YeaQ/YmgE (transglycosylase-associated protein family)
MIPVEWIVFLISFIASLLKAIWEGREAKTSIVYVILLIVASAIVGIILAFINAFLTQAAFTLTTKDLITYLFDAFIGAVIIPVARYLISVKIE